jgi:hypothetical protein
MLSGSVPDNAGGGIFVGSAPPSSSITFKVWFKIDGAGRPLGAYQFYNGNWRKVYTGVGIGDVKMYYGNGGNFDGTGRGTVGGECDGWAICNGNNGTPNMSDGRFPAGGSWNGSNWSSSGIGAQGGVNGHQIAATDLPPLNVQAWGNTEGVTLTQARDIIALGGYGAEPISQWKVNETIGSPNNALPLPRYRVFAFIMFVGYA